jgi:hypothetical protein
MCKSSPCVHGTCFDNKDGFVCSCSAGFRGKYCNTSKYVPKFKTKDTKRKCLILYFFKLKLLIKYELTKNKLNTVCRSIEIYRYPSKINFYCILLLTLSFAKVPCQKYFYVKHVEHRQLHYVNPELDRFLEICTSFF